MPYDARAIANFILDCRDDIGIPTTNLELQKLLYFCHGDSLVRTGVPLVSGVFEAWRNGPVNPAVYKSFKCFKNQPIASRAKKRNYQNNTFECLDIDLPDFDSSRIRSIIEHLSNLTAWQLVKLSHSKDGPWEYIVSKAQTGFVAGMRISDSVTISRFGKQKIIFGGNSKGEVIEVKPFE